MIDYITVEILWLDSSGYQGWQDVDDIDPKPHLIRSVGLLLRSDDEGLTITTSASDNGSVHAPITIPWCAVQEWGDV